MNKRNISRREFARQTLISGAALGILRAGGVGLADSKATDSGQTPIALQLYTVRNLLEKDFSGTLAKVAKIGYDAVETAGYGGHLSSKELKKLLADLGLQCAAVHESIEDLEKNLPKIIEFHLELGNKYVVCSYMPEPFQKRGIEGVKDFASRLNKAGAAIKQAGMQLCYHNHDFEFRKINGRYLLDYLYEAADPELVKAEVDTYWVQHGGEDPIALLHKYKGRCPLLHIKDMTKDSRRTFAPVGTGRMDFPGIIKAAREGNAVWFIVEQDEADQPVLEAIEISLKNLRQMLKA